MISLAVKMPLSEAFAVSLIGISVVMITLAVIACLIILVSKAVRSFEAALKKESNEINTTAPVMSSLPESKTELVGVEDKEAAVIMAIVSDKSGIPLERLSFKSIKLMEDEKKGDR